MKFHLFFLLLLISCQGSPKLDGSGNKISKLKKDSIENSSSNYRLFPRGYYFTKAVSNTLPIDSIENGYDSLQIRIWREQGLFQHRQLFVLKYNRKQWTGSFYEMMLDSNYANAKGSPEFLGGPQPFEVRKYRQVTPIIGWKKFTDSLFTLRILDLPDYTEVPGMEPKFTDPSATYIEIATSKSYRHYTYLDFEDFKSSFWQAENLSRILDLLYSQFGNITRFA